MFELPVLLALDFQEVVKVIIPLVVLVLWIISQVFGQKAGKADAPAAGNPRPRQPGAGGLKEEIERFLQEAKQQQEESPREREMRTQGGTAEAEKPNKQERQRRKDQRQREHARERAKALAAAGQRSLIEPEVVEDVMVVGPGSSLSKHVSSYMDSSSFRESASHLGEQVGLADERLEAHLHQAFDHRVSQFAGQPNEVDRGGAAVIHTVIGGAQLAAMLRDPLTFRHAVVLNEILSRPEHRWD